MKRLQLAIGTLFLPTALSLAIVDENTNGLSDLWEKAHNNGDLFSETYDPQADFDQDGWTNAQEAAAGTDPDNPNPPDGIIAPGLLHTPAVIGEENGQPIIITPEVLTVSWPTLIGKQYTLLFSPDLSPASWLQVPDSQFIGDGNIHEFNFDLSGGDKCFWRVAVSDTDTDQDGLTDAEEQSLGTNPQLADTDFDGLPDQWEVENNLAADDSTGDNGADGDPDGDGISNQVERNAGTKANNANDFPLHMISASKIAYGYSTQAGGSGDYDGGYFWNATGSGYDAETLFPVDVNYLDGILEGFPFPTDPSSPGSWILERDPAWVSSVSNESVSWLYGGLSSPPESGDWSCTGTVRASRVWLKAPAADHLRKYPYLHFIEQTITPVVSEGEDPQEEGQLEIESAEMVDFEVAANQTVSGHKDLDPHPPIVANSEVKRVEYLSRFGISDNNFASGVDNVSITAANTSTGYQDKYWIMAPCGNDTQNHPCENPMAFDVVSMPKALLTATCANAQMVLSAAADGGTHKWHGTGNTTSEAVPGFTLDGHSLTFPVGVKAMKRRTVKVALHEIVSVVPGRANDAPGLIPSKAAAEDYLNKIFAYQINAWFDVTRLPPEPIAFDTADASTYGVDAIAPGNPLPVPGDRILSYRNWSSPEVSLATAGRPDGYDVHVYVLGGATPIVKYRSTNVDSSKIEVHRSALGDSNLEPGANYCIIDGDRDQPTRDLDGNITGYQLLAKDRSPLAVLNTIAHEIGHIMIKDGHPDEGDGPAPLAGTDRTLRLMCGGDNSDPVKSVLLVKTEWDKAEAWLKGNVDK